MRHPAGTASRLNARTVIPTVFVVDDDPPVRESLSRVLRAGGWLVETFDSAEAFLASMDPLVQGCLLLDVMLPGLDGLELQRRLAVTGRELPIIFLTGHGDIPMSVHAMKSGAADFLTKPVTAEMLLAAVRTAVDEDSRRQRDRAERAELEQRCARLTPRELEVFTAVAAGRRNKQIAADLGIVEQTVKFHRAHIMERMQAKSVAELMLMAATLGIGRHSPERREAVPSTNGPPTPPRS